MFGVGSVELLILSILPIVVVFVLLYLVIKWTVSSALRGVSSAFREASAGITPRGRSWTSATPGAIRQGRDRARGVRAGTPGHKGGVSDAWVFAHFGTAVKALLNAAVVW
jgi:hypothetical protein